MSTPLTPPPASGALGAPGSGSTGAPVASGPPAGYGPPPAYGAPGYGTPTGSGVPPQPPAPQPGAPAPQRPRSSAARVITILLIVLGALIVVGAILSAVFGTIAAASVSTSSRTADVDGVSALDFDVSAGSLRVEFADVDEAELDVTATWGRDTWTFERQGDTLNVSSPNTWWGFGWIFGGSGDAVLRLPLALEGANADLTLSAGDLAVTGDLDTVALDISAGSATLGGSADTLTVDLSAGRVDLDVADVREAGISVSAGSVHGEISGAQPDSIRIGVSAGSVDLTVPEGEYDLRSDVSAGSFDHRLDTSSSASSTIDVEVSAGSVNLRTR